MYDDILSLIKKSKIKIDDEIKLLTRQLSDLAESKKKKGEIDYVLKWLDEKRKSYDIDTKEIGINSLDKWHVDGETGNIHHESGKFFSIIGIKVEGAKDREVVSWTQPMIKQNECGILGILCKKINGIRHYLLQAKYEPGNTDILQLSPTLQATESNLKRAHKGKKPLFSEYFEYANKDKILTSVVSVEDGGRFYLKTNRNMIVEIDDGALIEIPDNFIWLNSYQVKKLIKIDNIVNSLVRSIFGSI